MIPIRQKTETGTGVKLTLFVNWPVPVRDRTRLGNESGFREIDIGVRSIFNV